MNQGGLPSSRTRQVIALGVTQTIAWASSTYLPAVLAMPIARQLGVSTSMVFAAVSVSLVVMALLGPAIGRAIDRHGGREVLCLSNLVLALGLALLGNASNGPVLFLAWAVIGAGMALGLYDAAFAALVRLHGVDARGPITGITLFGGFASTLGWPLSAWIATSWDWQTACFFWTAVHLLVALPINAFGLPSVRVARVGRQAVDLAGPAEAETNLRIDRTFILLAVFGAATSFVTAAMSAHLPGLLKAVGVSAAVAIAAAALFGPAQVAARLCEYALAHRFRIHPLFTARFATSLYPLGAGLLFALGGAPLAVSAFALLYGAGNGLITIAKGTLPLALSGPRGYGVRQGALAVTQRITQAAAPFVFALVLENHGAGMAITLAVGVSLLALGALLALDRHP
jgi:predicted MFS family arabinose efflux permease